MNNEKITETVEFVSTMGGRGGIDIQINDWIKINPEATIVDVKYRVAVYRDGEKNKLAKLALVLFHAEESDAPKGLPKTESKQESKQKPGARTMVMNLRKDLNLGDQD